MKMNLLPSTIHTATFEIPQFSVGKVIYQKVEHVSVTTIK